MAVFNLVALPRIQNITYLETVQLSIERDAIGFLIKPVNSQINRGEA